MSLFEQIFGETISGKTPGQDFATGESIRGAEEKAARKAVAETIKRIALNGVSTVRVGNRKYRFTAEEI